MSRTVIMPVHLPLLSTTRSFSIRCWCRSFFATSGLTCSGTVTRSVVIISETRMLSSATKRMSRLVMMPTSLSSWSTTGSPEKPCLSFSARSSPIVVSGVTMIGSSTKPDSNRLTVLTLAAWSSILMFRWITPIPPAWAIAMAMRDSVTVSIAADIIGILRPMVLVSFVLRSTSAGRTADSAGNRRTSSKVNASGMVLLAIRDGPCRPYMNDSRSQNSTQIYIHSTTFTSVDATSQARVSRRVVGRPRPEESACVRAPYSVGENGLVFPNWKAGRHWQRWIPVRGRILSTPKRSASSITAWSASSSSAYARMGTGSSARSMSGVECATPVVTTPCAQSLEPHSKSQVRITISKSAYKIVLECATESF